MRCWGNNSSGQCNPPTDLGPCSSIAGGSYHTIALRIDGTVRCWGRNDASQCVTPNDLGTSTGVAGGGYYNSLAIQCVGGVNARVSPELAPYSFANPRAWTATGIQAASRGATITINARGNLGTATKFLTVKLDGVTLAATIFGSGSGSTNCATVASTATFVIPPAQFSALTADGELEVRIEPSLNATSVGCASATLTVQLNYLRDTIDCDANGIDDECDFAAGAEDENQNDKLDSCELLYGDLNLDGNIDGADLGGLLSFWGIPNPPYGDLDGDGMITGGDLGLLLSHWGVIK